MVVSNVFSGITLVVGLTAAVIVDWQTRRIPNRLVVALLATGLLLQFFDNRVAGFVDAIQGVGIAIILFMPGYALWGMGAGDVKLAMAVGAYMGKEMFFVGIAIYFTGIIAGFLILFIKGGIKAFIDRWIAILVMALYERKLSYIPPSPGEAAAGRFPYSFAIAGGTLLGYLAQNLVI